MNVSNFPASLRPIIQQGFLEREFAQALRSRLGYRACADRVKVSSARIGETITEERGGIQAGSTERYTITVNHYAATTDLNVMAERVGIVSQFLQNAYVNGEQAGRCLDELARNALFAAYGADPLRRHNAECASDLNATDTLTISDLLRAAGKLEASAVPKIDGAYNCYLDPISARQLFACPDFKQLFQGATSVSQVFKSGMTNDFLGLRFVPTNAAPMRPHPTIPSLMIRSPIICGMGALIEGDFAGMDAADVAPQDSIAMMVDGVAMVTRMAGDQDRQVVAQSWYWIGGFAAPADTVAGFQRAVVIEHVG